MLDDLTSHLSNKMYHYEGKLLHPLVHLVFPCSVPEAKADTPWSSISLTLC